MDALEITVALQKFLISLHYWTKSDGMFADADN